MKRLSGLIPCTIALLATCIVAGALSVAFADWESDYGLIIPLARRIMLIDSAGAPVNMARMGGSSKLLAVTKDTWTALGTADSEVLWITATSAADSKAAVITIWGSFDGGTTYRVLPRADTLSPAKSVALATGTDVIGAGTRCDGVAVMPFGSTHIYVQEISSDATITYTASGK